MPRLAVIMPVRNGEETLLRAVTSTLRALPRDACLLILDDASTDRTRQYVEQVDDPRIRLIASPYRLGVHGALNRLLDEVDAELVARMDADDICLPWRFRAELHALGRDTDVVFSPVVEFRTRPRRLAVQPPVGIPPEAMRLHMILANPVVHSTMLGRTEHLRRVGGYRALHAEDYDLWMRMCTRGSRLRRIALPTLLYRAHAGQVTASASWRGRALGEQQLRESYAELSTAVLGRSPA